MHILPLIFAQLLKVTPKRVSIAYKWGYNVIREYRMKTGIYTNVLTSWPWKVSQGQVQAQLSKMRKMARQVIRKRLEIYAHFALDLDLITQGHA